MKDFDFDELDRAVNSLIGPSDAVAPATAEAETAASGAATQPAQTPNLEQPRPTPEEAQKPSPAVKRTGKYMDVVHPAGFPLSSPTVRPASRQGVTIAPVSPPQSVAPSPTIQDVVNDTTRNNVNSLPDPLEFEAQKLETESTAPAVEDTVPTPELTGGVSPQENEAELLAALEDASFSPFLPDAKVEKRPLGGAPLESPVEEQQPEPAIDLESLETTDTATVSPPEQETPTPLPAELHEDIVAIESGGEVFDESIDKESLRETEPNSVDEAEQPVTEAVAPAIPEPTVDVSHQLQAGGSIPQQYKSSDVTSSDEENPVYDTEYHQPLSHPAKKKSGWGAVLWIIVTLGIGGGAGVLAYYFGFF